MLENELSNTLYKLKVSHYPATYALFLTIAGIQKMLSVILSSEI